MGAVGRSTVVEVVEAPASVVARAGAQVTAPATGTVRSLRVHDGQRVRKGQTLLVVDSPSTEAALTRAEAAAAGATTVDLAPIDLSAQTAAADRAARAAFARARNAAEAITDPTLRAQAMARIRRAEAQYQAASARAQALAEQVNQGVASVEDAVASLAETQQLQLQVAVTAARAAVAALTVHAPIAGTVVVGVGVGAGAGTGSTDLSGLVGSLPDSVASQAAAVLGGGGGGGSTTGALEVGSPVTAGDPLLTITDVSELSLTAQVDETDVLLVRRGVKADVELDAVPGATYAAVVRNVDLTPTTSTRGGVTYVVRLDLGGGTTLAGEPAPRPRPGMSAIAGLRVRTARHAVSVPVSAVFRDGAQDAVWRVDDGVAHKTPVVLGAQGEDFVQVLDGVAEGDQVVVSGADRVSEGQSVP